MANNIFAGLNEAMAEIVAKTTIEGLTPANLFVNILTEKNAVSEYIKKKADVKKIVLDFKESNISQRDNDSFKKKLRRELSELKNKTENRYLDEIEFILLLSRDIELIQIFGNIVGKYLDIDHVIEDFQKLSSPKPILIWEKNHSTILDIVGRNLTELAKNNELHKIVDRDDEIMRIIQILTRQTKSNPALVGEAGVGKTAVVEKLAHILLDKGSIPNSIHGWKLYEISIPAIVSTGDIEGTIEMVVEAAFREKVILFIDEVHLIMNDNGKIANLLKPAMARGDIKLIGATTEDEYKVFEKDKAMTRRFQPVKINQPEKTSVFRILKTKAIETEENHNVLIPNESLLKAIQLSERYMPNRQQPDKAIDLIEEASSKLRMILESKPEPLIKIQNEISNDEIEIEMINIQLKKNNNSRLQNNIKNLENTLKKNRIEEKRIIEKYNKQRELIDRLLKEKSELNDLKINLENSLHLSNFEHAADLQATEIPNKEKNILEFEKEILDFAQITDENLIQNVVTPGMLSKIIEDQTGIPVDSQEEDDLKKYRKIASVLKKEVHGQDSSIDSITSAIKRSKAGLSDPNKPLGSFLCLGPTGVGKTYFAQKLSNFMFNTDKVLKRFDMSEYMEAHSVARLFGSPPGYVGHDEGGQLTEEIKRNPYSIILFDEIEKAHPRVFDALLQILDAGRMTDGKGEIVNFKNTIILMTSNIGSDIIRQGLENNYPKEAIDSVIFDEIKKHFRPEFLNRFDSKVVFNSLSPENIINIANNELKELSKRLLSDNDIDLNWHKDMAILITNNAYDIIDGARPIKRFINNLVINKLTEGLLNGEIERGQTIYIRPDTDKKGIILFPLSAKELKVIRSEEIPEIKLRNDLIRKNPKPKKDKKDKKNQKNKKNKKNLMDETFSLDVEVGE